MSSKKSSEKNQAPKAPFSFRRHILPPLTGVFVMVFVFGLLNAQWITAQAQYRFTNIPTTNVSTSTTEIKNSLDPNAQPELIIPKINVRAPLVMDEPSYAEWKVQLALRKGVVHYGTSALPGEKGNLVVLGHSSGQLWAPGEYKFVFTMLDRLDNGDTFMITYKGTRYVYHVTNKKVVKPTDVGVVAQSTNIDPVATLITCTPVGTSKNRLVIQAKQISPNPAQAQKTATHTPLTVTNLPASDNTTTLWQRLKDLL